MKNRVRDPFYTYRLPGISAVTERPVFFDSFSCVSCLNTCEYYVLDAIGPLVVRLWYLYYGIYRLMTWMRLS